MFSEKDFERLWFLYKTEGEPNGVSINSFCIGNNIPYTAFYDWFKKTQKKVVSVEVEGIPEELIRTGKFTLIGKKNWIFKRFRYTFCGDEIFLQTVLWNSPYKENIYALDDEFKGCQREIFGKTIILMCGEVQLAILTFCASLINCLLGNLAQNILR